MSETVFILGAGASIEAGAPLMANFLEVADLLRGDKTIGKAASDFDLVFRAIAALRPAYSHANIDLHNNVESVFAAFEMAKLIGRLGSLSHAEINKLPGAMRRVIQMTLEKTIKFHVSNAEVASPVPYDDFARLVIDMADPRMKRYEKITVITFNYDICLDYAFHHNAVPINYCLDDEQKRGVKLLKLHGSLNWARCLGCEKVVPWNMPNYFQTHHWLRLPNAPEAITLEVSRDFSSFKHCPQSEITEPFIIPPTWNKTQHHEQIDRVWRAAASELNDAVNILVCGYSLPSTDHFFRYLYALATISEGRLRKFLVFNPDEDHTVEARFREIVGPAIRNHFDFSRAVFKGAIGMIRNILNLGP